MKHFHARPGPPGGRSRLGHRDARPLKLAACAFATLVLLAGCSVGPDYVRPSLDIPAAYKESGNWKLAEPRTASGQAWWLVYGDPTLDALMRDAERANQTLRQAEAQYRLALATADVARAAFFPTVGANAGAQRARTNTSGTREATVDSLGLSASWQPDFWGGVRRSVEAGEAGAAASADDLASAHLSIQATLAQDYFLLRMNDRLRDLYAATVEGYERALKLTRAQRAAGVALQSDVALAESQLATAQAQSVDIAATRATLEHAIAILTGRAPATFTLPPVAATVPLGAQLPVAPTGLPSELLERRPDIAAAERRVAQANANIGVARAAFYPSLTLSASGGFSAATIGTLFDTPARVWSLGAALAQSLFDGGLRTAREAQAVASYDASVASYKQTVLVGFQQVEDNLATLRLLQDEAALQDTAVSSALTAERSALAQYRAGTANYLSVVTAQALSLTAQRTAVQLRGRRLTASVSLVAATGGGFDAAAPAPTVAPSSSSKPSEQPSS